MNAKEIRQKTNMTTSEILNSLSRDADNCRQEIIRLRRRTFLLGVWLVSALAALSLSLLGYLVVAALQA